MSGRRALRGAALLALAAAALAPALPAEPAAAVRPAHVVLVVLGGGVRAAEMLDPLAMPTVAAIGARGAVVDGLAASAGTPFAASVGLLTGRADAAEEATRRPPAHPTLLECVRRHLGLPAERVWFVSHEGGDELLLAASQRAEYGAAAAPETAFGAGAFGEPLAALLGAWGRPLPTEDASWALLRALRARNRAVVETWLPADVDAGLAESERVERAFLAELDRRTLLATGPAPADDRAVRAATTVLLVHRPALCVVRLGAGTKAQGGIDGYRAALAADDAALGRLRSAVAADPALRDTTAFLVVSDMGRNAEPDAKGRLGSDDRSAKGREVAAVAEGPGIRRGARAKGERTVADVAPTVARLLGVPMPEATGRALTEILDPALARE